MRQILFIWLSCLVAAICLGGCDSSSDDTIPPDNTIFSDDFERPNTLDGLGDNWQITLPANTTFNIFSRQAYPVAADSAPFAFFKRSVTQEHVIATVVLKAFEKNYNGEVFLYARSQSLTSIDDTYACGFRASDKLLVINRILAGTALELVASGSQVMPLLPEQVSTLSMELDAFQLTCNFTGAQDLSISITDTTYFAGYLGVKAGNNSNNTLYIDDFSITNVP